MARRPGTFPASTSRSERGCALVAAQFGADLRTAALQFSAAPDVAAALIVGAHTEAQVLANVSSMQATISAGVLGRTEAAETLPSRTRPHLWRLLDRSAGTRAISRPDDWRPKSATAKLQTADAYSKRWPRGSRSSCRRAPQQISDDLTKAFLRKTNSNKARTQQTLLLCALLHHPRYGSLFVKSNRIKENIYAEKPSFRHRSRFAVSCRDHPSTGFGKLRSLHRAAQCRYVPDLLKLDGAGK